MVNLSWEELDKLREHKKETPFSGTTAVFNMEGDAFYFSKNIIPAIRKEEKVRAGMETSPVYRQVGLYGYRLDVLRKIAKLLMRNWKAWSSCAGLKTGLKFAA